MLDGHVEGAPGLDDRPEIGFLMGADDTCLAVGPSGVCFVVDIARHVGRCDGVVARHCDKLWNWLLLRMYAGSVC